MSAYIIINSELVAIANAIREKLSSDNIFTLDDMPTAIANIGTITGSGATVAVGNNTKYLINETKLTAIADAVRLKNGSSSQYLLSELPQAILDIVTITYTVNYYNGSTLLYSEDVPAGSNSSYVGSTPTKASDAQYSYTFSGWSDGVDDNTVDSNAFNNITEDKNVYACFTSTLRTYTVTFVRAAADGGGTLQTLNNVAYGTVLTNSSYTGSTPITTQGSGSDYAFLGWTPSFTAITGDTTYTAQFDNPVKEITDTWDTIIANIDNGTYASVYKVGNYKPLDLGSTYGTVNMQIVAMDADELSGGGTAPLSFVAMELLLQNSKMQEIGSSFNGWPETSLRSWLLSTIKPSIPSSITSRLQSVNKTYYNYSTRSTETSADTLWIPSMRELGLTQYNQFETSGIVYSKIYKTSDNTTRQKTQNAANNAYWTRTSRNNNNDYCYTIKTDGTYTTGGYGVYNTCGVCLGFCLGLEPEEPIPPVGLIEDSWETIISKINSGKAKYQVGSYKPLDLGSEGIVNMQIVGKNTSPLASGSGTATYDWVSMETLTTKYNMNSINNTEGGWELCECRTYLKETIKPLIPEVVRNAIKQVTKYSRIFHNGSAVNNVGTTEDVWIPSAREIFGGTSYETQGSVYDGVFTNAANRIKTNASSTSSWWLRSVRNKVNFYGVGSSGDIVYNGASVSYALAIGFSI